MRRDLVQIGFTICALMLAGCGLADSYVSLPGFLRVKESAPPPPEPPPDVRQLVRENLNSVFVSNSYPRAVRVSSPVHDLRGLGWNACVRAQLTNAVGKPLGNVTYRISIESGAIFDRQRVRADDPCASESYERIQ